MELCSFLGEGRVNGKRGKILKGAFYGASKGLWGGPEAIQRLRGWARDFHLLERERKNLIFSGLKNFQGGEDLGRGFKKLFWRPLKGLWATTERRICRVHDALLRGRPWKPSGRYYLLVLREGQSFIFGGLEWFGWFIVRKALVFIDFTWKSCDSH